MYATEYIVLSEHDLIKEPGQPQWSPSKNVVKDLRTENRKLKDQVIIKICTFYFFFQSFFKWYIKIAIQETQIQALQQSLQEIEDEAVLQKENNKLVDGLVRERNDLKQLVQKLSEQLGNLSAEQSLQNSRVSSPTWFESYNYFYFTS